MVFLEKFFAETLGLTKFPPYLSTFYWAFLGFTLVHQVLAPYFSERWFPSAYGGKGRAAKNNWCVCCIVDCAWLRSVQPSDQVLTVIPRRSIHVVSQVHALVIVPYALWCIIHEDPVIQDRAFGWDGKAGYLYAIACG